MGIKLVRWSLRRRPNARLETVDLVVKTKPRDKALQRLVEDVVAFCDSDFGRLLRRFPLLPGLGRSHLREAAVHGFLRPVAGGYIPLCYAAWSHPGGQRWSQVSEYVEGVKWPGSPAGWTVERLGRTIDALAVFHGAGFKQGQQLEGASWLANAIKTDVALEARPLWRSLADFTEEVLGKAVDSSLGAALQQLINGMAAWWPVVDAMPRTLIHNDLNPRNVIWQASKTGERPCFIDWELARRGAPQSDLMELLSFVLPTLADEDYVRHAIDHHRRRLEEQAGRAFNPYLWFHGARLALWRFGVERLPLYAVVHRVRLQPFIEDLAARWMRLLAIMDHGPSRTHLSPAKPYI